MARYKVDDMVTSKVKKTSFKNGFVLCEIGDTLKVIEILGSNYTVRNTNNRIKCPAFFIKDNELE
jgi:hypothetical protein